MYLDSFGEAYPSKELVKYLGEDHIDIIKTKYQNYTNPLIRGYFFVRFIKLYRKLYL